MNEDELIGYLTATLRSIATCSDGCVKTMALTGLERYKQFDDERKKAEAKHEEK